MPGLKTEIVAAIATGATLLPGMCSGGTLAAPQATVLRIKDASHVIFRSNEAEVLQAMSTFIAKLR
jgi:hypothetical protein